MKDQPDWICAICSSALESRTDKDGSTLTHPMAIAADHAPQPVRPGPEWRGKCDFCTTGVPEFVLPARSFRVPNLDLHHSLDAWSACSMCALLISSDRWTALVRRAANAWATTAGLDSPPDAVVTQIGALYRALRKAITGPLRPLGGGKK